MERKKRMPCFSYLIITRHSIIVTSRITTEKMSIIGATRSIIFEQLCKDHISQIKNKLGISGVLSEESTWYTRGDEELGVPGAQIDLLIERRDRVINVCEIKFSLNEYVIDKEYDMIMRNKLEAFRRMTNCKKTLQTTMITTYGVKRGKYSGIIHSQITLDDLFQ